HITLMEELSLRRIEILRRMLAGLHNTTTKTHNTAAQITNWKLNAVAKLIDNRTILALSHQSHRQPLCLSHIRKLFL
ncbi:MAG: hypothetical protein B7Y29_05560, partial [Thiotrichales bacterium 16-46-22]